MKKIYNLFSWVAIINLMMVLSPWRMMAFAEVGNSEGPPVVVDDIGEEIETSGEDEIVPEDELENKLPILYIRAVNPGYKIDGINNVGEMIEIGKNSDDVISLAGVTVRYTNSSGKETVLVEFPENSYLVGESLLLRFDGAPMSELSNVKYSTTLALKAGPIALLLGDDELDSVCWNNKEGCEKEFVSSKPVTLVRNLETTEFERVEEYVPEYDEKSYEIVINDDEAESDTAADNGGVDDEKKEDESVDSDGKGMVEVAGKVCTEGYYLNESTNRCRKIVEEKEKICAEGYYLYEETGRCRKIVVEEEKVCAEGYYLNESTNRCRKIVEEKEKTCGEGYYLNEETGRCRKIVVEEEKTCAEGQYLNPATGRCKKIEVEKKKTCAAGYYLNEATGRCKKIVEEKEKTCAEGYYLNGATGRCKKIVENNGANYELVAEKYDESSSFIALYAVLGVLGAGLIYVIYEFRQEIRKFFKKIFSRK